MSYIEKLVEIRKEKNILQSDLAEILHTTQQQVSKYETGKQAMPMRHLITIAKELNVSIDYLINENELSLDSDEYELIQIYNKLSHLNKVRVLERARVLLEYEMDKRRKNDNG